MTDTHTPTAIQVVERHQAPAQLHPLVTLAMSEQMDPAKLEKLLAVQQQWEADEARKAYARAMIDLKAKIPTVIAKDATVDFAGKGGRVHYKHASLAGVVDAVTGIMAAHGFSMSCPPSTDGNKVTVTCRITHQGGHKEECSISEMADGSSAIKGIPGTITRLQRYAILSMLGLATGDMPERHDNDAVSQVDAAANLKMCAALLKRGITKSEAVTHVGRHVQEWTSADLEVLRSWKTETAHREQATAPTAGPPTVSGEPSPVETIKAHIAGAATKQELAAIWKALPKGMSKAEVDEIQAAYAARLEAIKVSK